MVEQILVGKPLLENIFGENNTVKVLDFLLAGKDFDFTLTHISNGTKLSRTAVRHAILMLCKTGLVIKSRNDKKSKYYRINRDNNKFKLLSDLHQKLVTEVLNS